MSNDALAVVQEVDKLIPPPEILDIYMKQADFMVKAGMLPTGYKSAADVVTVALRAREMGVSFWEATQSIFPVKGRMGYMGGFLLSRIYTRFPEAEIKIKKNDKTVCVLEVRKNAKEDFETVTVTFEEAHALGWDMAYEKKKQTWADPTNMLYWRAVTRACNRHFSQVFGSPVYTPEELQDIPDETKTPPPATLPYLSLHQVDKPANVEVVEPVVAKPEPKKDTPYATAEVAEVTPVEKPEPSPEQPPPTPEPAKEMTLEEKLQELKDMTKDAKNKLEYNNIHNQWAEKHVHDPKALMEGFNYKKEARKGFNS